MAEFARAAWEEEELVHMDDSVDDVRFGGAQADEEGGGGDEEERKRKEREAKKAEVRKRLEESNKKKAKKGFLTPERKKKLRKLLMLKAAEDLKAQQLKKEQERQKILSERTVKLPDVDSMSDQAALEKIAKEMVAKIAEIEDKKYDLDFMVRAKDHEINELSIAVNDLRGKFVKPTLKKVSKYDNKFKKLQQNSEHEKQDFRANLKKGKDKTKDLLESLKGEGPPKEGGPDWAKKPQREEAPAADAADEEEEFKKMAGSNPPGAMKVNFRENLKIVKQDKYGLEELTKDKEPKPEGEEAPAE